jgi:hypothetical protein
MVGLRVKGGAVVGELLHTQAGQLGLGSAYTNEVHITTRSTRNKERRELRMLLGISTFLWFVRSPTGELFCQRYGNGGGFSLSLGVSLASFSRFSGGFSEV